MNNRRPFELWEAGDSTQTLPWYAAYNAVKHDRETEFSQARLEHLFDSIAAVAIMLQAQFGTDRVQLGSLTCVASPVWSIKEYYIAPFALWHSQGGLRETEHEYRQRAGALWSKVNVAL